MCGRIAVYRPADVLAAMFVARETPALREHYEPSFNVGPTRVLPGLVAPTSGERLLSPYRWGFRNRLFNARAETVATSPAFAPSLASRRVAVLADGFFEWTTGDGGRRHPLFFHRADGEPLIFAGLWEPDDGLPACTVVTTVAGEDLVGIHDRMPVILEPDALDRWLGEARLRTPERETILRPSPGGTLVHHAVDPRVGDVRNDGPDLIVPFVPPTEALRLFG